MMYFVENWLGVILTILLVSAIFYFYGEWKGTKYQEVVIMYFGLSVLLGSTGLFNSIIRWILK